MDEQELDQLLERAGREWRVPVDPPLGQIWQGVAREQLERTPRWTPGWWTVAAAAVAALVIGVAGGRYSSSAAKLAVVPVTAHAVSPATQPTTMMGEVDQRSMGELLGRTAVLLAALPTDSTPTSFDPALTREGARLLTTTRLLLDSPAGANPRLRNLLQDLELVLVQVARLEPHDRRVEIQFIQTALDEHDLVPRLRSAAADFSPDEF
ncbi:MAG TPA: hypothetical protein VGM77_05770 [Gemmatimonadales bacterium]|jgi:hypothetical protein